MKRLLLVLVVLGALPLSAQTVEIAPAGAAANAVRSLVINDAGDYRTDLRNFYAPAGYRLVWISEHRPTAQALAVIAQLENAATKGLDPADYGSRQWQVRRASLRSDADRARFEVALTSTLMRYASDLSIGRVDPQNVRFDFDIESKKLYLPAVVAQIAASPDPIAVLSSIEPQNEEYRSLLTALATYRRIAAESAHDAPLPVVARLSPNQSYDALPQLAAMLRRNGDLAADVVIEGTLYSGAIVDAAKRFQKRHGLAADGVISKKTFAQLNTPASYRVQQIEWALERRRWAPSRIDAPSVVVNIPEFRLRARDENDEELSMRVVVGRAAGHKTPVFAGDIKHVVFRPYWSVPPTIQRGEIVPNVERDATYLARNNYEVVDGSGRSIGSDVDGETLRGLRKGSLAVRQKPGRSNALGLVKFLFPNENDVYLHSTPQQSLFSRSRRDFSHGCIRVEDPVALAEWTLRQTPGWTKTKIESMIRGERDDIYVKVRRPIAVMILYTTAVAAADGEVRFFEDIYGYDALLANALQGAPNTKSAPAALVAAGHSPFVPHAR